MSLLSELRRRNVFKVAISYLVLAWVVVQVTSIAVPALHLPPWVNTLVFYFGAIGFPFALFFAWAFELTPEGIKRSKEVESEHSIAHLTGRKLDFAVIAMLTIALGLMAHDRMGLIAEQKNAQLPINTPQNTNSNTIGQSLSENPSQQKGSQRKPIKTSSIAVLPFVNMSSDPEQEYFSDGISEELLNLLAKIPKMQVAGRTSSFAFKGLNQDLREIGKKLGVDHLLEGSVRKQGMRIRITAQLIRTKDGIHLWSETYDRNLDDIFAVQDEIAKKITQELRINLLNEQPVTAKKSVNPKAHNLYLLGLKRLAEYEYKPMLEARNYFEKSYQLAPNYEDAYFAYARANLLLKGYGVITKVEAKQNIALTLTKLASITDTNSAEYLAFLGVVHFYDKDEDTGIELLKQALEKSPNNIAIIRIYLDFGLGTNQSLISLSKHAIELDPLNLDFLFSLGLSYAFENEFDKAMIIANTMEEIDAEYSSLFYLRMTIYTNQGNLVDTLQTQMLVLDIDRNDPEVPASIALTLMQLGFHQQAMYYLTLADKLGKDKPMTVTARIYSIWAQGDLATAGEMAYNFLISKPNHRFFTAHFSFSIMVEHLLKTKQYKRLNNFLNKEVPDLATNILDIPITAELHGKNKALALTSAKIRLLYIEGKTTQAKALTKQLLAYHQAQREQFPNYDHGFFWAINLVLFSDYNRSQISDLAKVLKQHEKHSMIRLYAYNKGFIGFDGVKNYDEFIAFNKQLNKDLERQRNIIIDQHPELIATPITSL